MILGPSGHIPPKYHGQGIAGCCLCVVSVAQEGNLSGLSASSDAVGWPSSGDIDHGIVATGNREGLGRRGKGKEIGGHLSLRLDEMREEAGMDCPLAHFPLSGDQAHRREGCRWGPGEKGHTGGSRFGRSGPVQREHRWKGPHSSLGEGI